MGKYVLRRLFMGVLVVIIASILIFSIIYLVPGDPATLMLSPEASPEEILAKKELLGLNDPYLMQLGKFLYNAFVKFDLGTSWRKNIPVMDGLMDRLPYTLKLNVSAIILSALIAIPLGVTAAVHRNGWQDRFSMVFAMFCASVPSFWLALMLILLLSQKLNLLPAFGVGGFEYYIMPVFCAAISSIGGTARQTRSSMLEVIRADYVTTARAKGLPEKKVILKHMLPNALIPVITIIGGSFSRCIGGSVVIESIFSLPGVGTYLTSSISARDYPIIRGCVIILAAFTAIVMLLVDLCYAAVDPRIKAQYAGKSKRRKANG